MLKIFVPSNELFDEVNREFIYTKDTVLILEHSLVSLSKWETIWKKPFLTKDKKTLEEVNSYIECMCLNQNIDPNVIKVIPDSEIIRINNYIEDNKTATWFSKEIGMDGKTSNREIVTSELIYYWMVALQIPFECQKWHLSRLITLIKVCNIKNAPPKKMSKNQLINRNRALNKARRERLNSKG